MQAVCSARGEHECHTTASCEQEVPPHVYMCVCIQPDLHMPKLYRFDASIRSILRGTMGQLIMQRNDSVSAPCGR